MICSRGITFVHPLRVLNSRLSHYCAFLTYLAGMIETENLRRRSSVRDESSKRAAGGRTVFPLELSCDNMDEYN